MGGTERVKLKNNQNNRAGYGQQLVDPQQAASQASALLWPG